MRALVGHTLSITGVTELSRPNIPPYPPVTVPSYRLYYSVMPKKKKTAAEIEAEAIALERANRRKKKALEESQVLDDDGELAEAEGAPLPGASKAAQIIADLKGEGSFEVYQLAGGKQSKLATYDIVAWPEAMESLVKSVGPGDYLVLFRDNEGHQVGRTTRTFNEVFCGVKPVAAAATAPVNNDGLFSKFLELQSAERMQHAKEMAEMRLELQRIQSENTKALLDVFRSNNQGFLKNAQELAAFKQLFTTKEENPVRQMLELKDLLEDFRGEVKETSSPVWEKLLNGIASGLLQNGPRKAHTPHAPPPKLSSPPVPKTPLTPAPALAPSSPQEATSISPSEVPGSSEVPAQNGGAPASAVERPSLLVFEPMLAEAVNAGKSADAFALEVDDQTDSEQKRSALLYLAREGDWDSLKAQPSLAASRSWLDDFRDALIDFLSEVPEGVPAEAAA